MEASERGGVVRCTWRTPKKKRGERPPRWCFHSRLPGRLIADRVSCAVEFLIQHALFVAGQAAAMLCSHVVRFLTDHVEAMMQCATLRGRICACVDVSVDAAAQVVGAAVNLPETLYGDFVCVRMRCRCLRLRYYTSRQRRNQRAASQRTDETLHTHSLSWSFS